MELVYTFMFKWSGKTRGHGEWAALLCKYCWAELRTCMLCTQRQMMWKFVLRGTARKSPLFISLTRVLSLTFNFRFRSESLKWLGPRTLHTPYAHLHVHRTHRLWAITSLPAVSATFQTLPWWLYVRLAICKLKITTCRNKTAERSSPRQTRVCWWWWWCWHWYG